MWVANQIMKLAETNHPNTSKREGGKEVGPSLLGTLGNSQLPLVGIVLGRAAAKNHAL
jgi:hypothetical protein